MIFYANKKTYSIYKLDQYKKLSKELKAIDHKLRESEGKDSFFQWGFQIFYYKNLKCIHMIHYASYFHLILFDIKDMKGIVDLMFSYLFTLYEDNEEMAIALKKMFNDNRIFMFDALKNEKIQKVLRKDETEILDLIPSYIHEETLDTVKINHFFNFERETKSMDKGTLISIQPSEYFKEIVMDRYLKEESL